MKFSKEGWLDIGLAAMASDGPSGLTIEAICKRAKKTRGSFYHHFSSAPAFIKQLSDWWVQKYTVELIEKSKRLTRPSEKLDHLNRLAALLDPKIEQAFRRLAAINQETASLFGKVDQMRIDYLTRLYRQSGVYDDHQAKILAKIEYAAFVGMQQIARDAEPEEKMEMYAEFLKLTGR